MKILSSPKLLICGFNVQELKKTSELQHQLPELLSRPVQRILEYKLLLKVSSKFNFFYLYRKAKFAKVIFLVCWLIFKLNQPLFFTNVIFILFVYISSQQFSYHIISAAVKKTFTVTFICLFFAFLIKLFFNCRFLALFLFTKWN